MATNTPTIHGPDGVARTRVVFSTNINSRFLTGTVSDTDVVNVQVSVNGAAFEDNPDIVVFDGVNWTVPNSIAYPDGIYLIPGVNTIAVRSVALSGVVSNTATATITYVPGTVSLSAATPPTNISVLRKDASVVLSCEPTVTDSLVGINVYAATAAGGGSTGYTRINIHTVTTGETVEETAAIGSSEQEYLSDTDTDPLYAVVVGGQQNASGTTLSTDFTDRYLVPEGTTRLRTAVSVVSVRAYTSYSFEHSRTATNTSTPPTVFVASFATLDPTVPIYYVVTAVYYNESTQTESESPFSAEVAGNPLQVTAQVGSFPVVSRQVIVRDTIASILRTNPQVRVDPGSVLRDTFIDPFANEAERLRFIVDFLHRAQSFAALLLIDDPTGSGVSIPVASSNYKTALKSAFRLNNDTDVQNVIDRSFEALASNYGVIRRSGRAARGDVTFYTTRRPTESIIIPIGTVVGAGSVNFTVVQAATLSLSQLASYYDPVARRYAVTVAVQATVGGATGNVAAGQIRRVVTGPTVLSVINASAMFGGTNQETNTELATRARNALASVDSGTKQGYMQTAADVAGVLRVNVVSAGDTLMMRDVYDGAHIGGKVDVWVQGDAQSIVTDVFAFQYNVAKDIHFEIVGDVGGLTFRAVDPNLSESTPIIQLLNAPNIGYAFRNATTGEEFDLTGVTFPQYDTVQLDNTIPQPTVTLTDVVLGDYRWAQGNTYVFRRQPVDSVESIVGTVSGNISSDSFALYHPDDPLLLGRSTLASDTLQITPTNGIPSGGVIQITNEEHTLVGEYNEYLDSLGVDIITIVVTDTTGLVTFATSGDPSGFYDYAVVAGTETTPTAIVRISTGRIPDGGSVLVSYQHAENFTVTYTVNQIPTQVQTSIDAHRHITADVLAKAALPWRINLAMTVILAQGAQRSRVDANVQTTLTSLFDVLRLGEPLRQSDVISAVESVTGVSYVIVPLTQMSIADGSIVLRDPVRNTSTYIAAWSTPTVSVWLLGDALTAIPQDAGGTSIDFRSVTQNDVVLVLVNASPDTELMRGGGRAYIVGAGGVVIPGITDDATLRALGYTTESEILAARASLSAGRVIVSTTVDDSPANHTYTATYVVGTDTRVYDLDPGAAEYLILGDLTITYDEDR